ncbi:MAG: hypothetical protein HQK99_15645 [Nitrospirae bacterium]|nr:hypothetical protein [Nitrospirota bacterium]
MSLSHLEDELKNGLPSPVYLLNYKDYFYLVYALKMLGDSVDEGDRTFNFDVYDLDAGDEQASMAEIIDTLNMASLFAGRRFVCIKNFQKILKGDTARLAKYVENPSSTSVLLLFNQLKEKDKRDQSPDKSLQAKPITLDFNERELFSWAQKKIVSYGCSITMEALKFLKEICGDSISKFTNELDKLTLLGKKKIDTADAAEAVFGSKGFTIFQVAEAIIRGDKSNAIKMYVEIRDGLDEIMALGALNYKLEKSIKTGSPAFLKSYEYLNEANKNLRGANQKYPLEFLIYNLTSIFGSPPSR